MGPRTMGDPADPIDRLMWVTGGEVLRVGYSATGGELDSYTGGAVSSRTMRRLAGAGLVSRDGLEADRLQHECATRSAECARMNPDELVSWYVREAVAGLDHRAARRAGELEQLERPYDPDELEAPAPAGEIPAWVGAWIGRTVHEPKADYLARLASWYFLGELEPMTPQAAWGAKCRGKFLARVARAARLEAPAMHELEAVAS